MDLAYADKDKFQKMLGIYAKEKRESLGLSLSVISQRTGIPAARLRRIESGLSPLKSKTVDSLSSALSFDEKKLETLVEIARVGFVDQFMELSWAEGEE